MLMDKKGGAEGFIYILLAVCIIAIVGVFVLIGGSFLNELIIPLGDDIDSTATVAVEAQQQIEGDITPIFDNFGFWFLIAFGIGIVFVAIYTDYHPAVIVVGILFMIIAVYGGMQAANMYDDLKTDADVLTHSSGFTLSNVAYGWLLPFIILGFCVIGIIIMIGKRKDSGAF